MKETEKRMNYYNLSSSIIACENYLPKGLIDNLYMDFLNNRGRFDTPNWSHRNTKPKYMVDEKGHNVNCEALDYWINFKDNTEHDANIKQLVHWFLHQGFSSYIEKNGCPMYNFITLQGIRTRDLAWDIHVISYNNDGYYNWHTDCSKNNLFTFNLILNKSNKLNGGNMMFMEDGKIIEVKNKNNFMVVFPSYIPHAITPLQSDDNKDVAFLEQRFSVQFWVRWRQEDDE
tara:strand:- start:2744 stop:3433 length:690 start_codon:yes stop_codon:yes gene_type:complete